MTHCTSTVWWRIQNIATFCFEFFWGLGFSIPIKTFCPVFSNFAHFFHHYWNHCFFVKWTDSESRWLETDFQKKIVYLHFTIINCTAQCTADLFYSFWSLNLFCSFWSLYLFCSSWSLYLSALFHNKCQSGKKEKHSRAIS